VLREHDASVGVGEAFLSGDGEGGEDGAASRARACSAGGSARRWPIAFQVALDSGERVRGQQWPSQTGGGCA
jgi:hypothetical protein